MDGELRSGRAGADGGREDAFPSRPFSSVLSEPPWTAYPGWDRGRAQALAVGHKRTSTPRRAGLGSSRRVSCPRSTLAPLGAAARTWIPDPGRSASPASGLQGGGQKGIFHHNFVNVFKVLILLSVFPLLPCTRGNHGGLKEFLTGPEASPSWGSYLMP